jgi:hypothetical protein
MSTLLIARGQFFVLSAKTVSVHVLDVLGTSNFWDGMEIAETRSRNVDQAREYVLRQTFGSDCIGFMPANSSEALLYYTEHYEGLHATLVKQLAACILTGTPFSLDARGHSDGSGGEKVTGKPVQPVKPAPAGQVFETQGVNA